MTIHFKIVSPEGYEVAVTKNGELVVGTLSYSEPYYVELGVDDQIYNVVPAKVNKRFVITGMIIGADRNVATDATVHIYESLSEDGTTDKDIFRGDINKGETIPLSGLNVATQEARWINATTDNDDIDLTIAGYYVNA